MPSAGKARTLGVRRGKRWRLHQSLTYRHSGMGVPNPDSIKKAIEVLQKKAGRLDDEIQEMIDEFEGDKNER